LVEKIKNKVDRLLSVLPHPWRWLIVTLLGFLIIIVGIIMLPLPGPGSLIIFLGVTILAIEFEWARELAKKGEQGFERALRWVKEKALPRLKKKQL
jgi:uncharacterized protein (TIGR02611 family)